MPTLTPEELAALQAIDSATIANAIEKFRVRPDLKGYCGPEIRCLFPQLGTMVGYAVTAVMEHRDVGETGWRDGWMRFCQAIEDSPKPVVAVIKDGDRFQAALVGEVMATTMKALGAVGCLTDGAVRDLDAVEAIGFHYFAAGVIVSHGQMKFTLVQEPVQIGRLRVRPGDLLHGGRDGLVSIPLEIAARVPEAAAQILANEARIMEFVRRPGFRTRDLGEFYH